MASRMWFVAAILAATAVTVRAEPAPDRDARRLALAKVWLKVKVAHPAVVRGQVDPDAAMPAAIAKVDAATTKEGLRRSHQGSARAVPRSGDVRRGHVAGADPTKITAG